jgi:hypothetical protein
MQALQIAYNKTMTVAQKQAALKALKAKIMALKKQCATASAEDLEEFNLLDQHITELRTIIIIRKKRYDEDANTELSVHHHRRKRRHDEDDMLEEDTEMITRKQCNDKLKDYTKEAEKVLKNHNMYMTQK